MQAKLKYRYMKYTYKNKYFLHIYYKHKETKENGRLIEQLLINALKMSMPLDHD